MNTPRLLDAENSLLLVIDIQEKFIPVLHDAERLIERTGILVQGARELGIPVVVTEQYPKGLGHTVEELKHLLPESAAVLEKSTFGCLGNDAIRAHVSGLGKKQVVVCGLETHVCVNQTVHQLLGEGYEVHLAQDAIASRHKKNMKTAMSKMLQSGAIPTCVEMVLFEWLRCSTHPTFKTLQALVK